jgi:GT2 family glycosyltransferase
MKAGVVVLHFGDPAHTRACLASVAASHATATPLVVVDNGTRTITAADVTATAPGAAFVPLPENLGFAGGCNVGIRLVMEAGSDCVVLLNNDARLEPDCLGELLRAAAEPRVAAVGAKVLSAADPSRVWATWGRLTWRAALVEMVGRGERDGPNFDVARDVQSVPGTVMLLTRGALEAIGFLDERFFAYHEDLDWCTTARAKGWRIRFAPAARATHQGEGSFAARGHGTPARYLAARNSVLFARKHGRLAQRIKLALAVGLSLPGECLRLRRRGEAAAASLLVRGYRDGLLGRDVPYRSLGLR